MTKQEKIEELESEIAEITTALTHIRKGGQSYEITSASGSGTKRVVTMADYNALNSHRDKLRAELAALNNTRAVRVGASW
jgi:prefoldin subunit 5